MSCVDEDEELYQYTLEKVLNILCEAMLVESEIYDRDQADTDCYIDCANDAAKLIKRSGLSYDGDQEAYIKRPTISNFLVQSNRHYSKRDWNTHEVTSDIHAAKKMLASSMGKFSEGEGKGEGKVKLKRKYRIVRQTTEVLIEETDS